MDDYCANLSDLRADIAVAVAVERSRKVFARYDSLLARHGKERQGWEHPLRPSEGPMPEGQDYYRPIVGCSIPAERLNIGATYASTDTDDRDAIERGEYTGERYYSLASMDAGIRG